MPLFLQHLPGHITSLLNIMSFIPGTSLLKHAKHHTWFVVYTCVKLTFLARATSLYKPYSGCRPACRVTNFSASDWSKQECYILEEVIEVDEVDEENKTNMGRLSRAQPHWNFYCPSLFDCSCYCLISRTMRLAVVLAYRSFRTLSPALQELG